MKKTTVTIQWREGLHLRPAARLVKLARNFQSQVTLRVGSAVADATSILSVLVLSATMSAVMEVEASGPDEQDAIAAVEGFFNSREEFPAGSGNGNGEGEDADRPD